MNPKLTPVITPEHLAKAYTYAQYRALISSLLAEGKTTGPKQYPALLKYAELNVQRMQRWDRTAVLNEGLLIALREVKGPWIWLVLTEGWCGDAAQSLPIIIKMAEVNPNISIKLLLRDENLDIMDHYLTNGGRSIPKLICLKADTLEEIGNWGPRPAVLQSIMLTTKANNPEITIEELGEIIHTWYAKDKSQHLQNEFEALVQEWNQAG
jgi:hypothetical protein